MASVDDGRKLEYYPSPAEERAVCAARRDAVSAARGELAAAIRAACEAFLVSVYDAGANEEWRRTPMADLVSEAADEIASDFVSIEAWERRS